ncbi:MAG: hypothetical protein SFY32_14435 [Bacteroidota bacterium]|nr:hypothetical protein [Bacteroidota bacterium]
MSILDLFTDSKVRKGKAHLKNLIQMAMADGKLEDTEYQFLVNVGSKYGIDVKGFEKIKDEVSAQKTYKVEKKISKFDQLYDLVKMMMIDNHIDNRELLMCKNFAKKIGFAVNVVDDLIESIKSNIMLGNSVEETRARVSIFIKE